MNLFSYNIYSALPHVMTSIVLHQAPRFVHRNSLSPISWFDTHAHIYIKYYIMTNKPPRELYGYSCSRFAVRSCVKVDIQVSRRITANYIINRATSIPRAYIYIHENTANTIIVIYIASATIICGALCFFAYIYTGWVD